MNATINPATPQDTEDHMLGSGALSFSWWQGAIERNIGTPGWEADLTCEDGDEGTRTVTVNHQVVMAAARKVLAQRPRFASDALVHECRNLVFSADEADFDACSADELLQVIVLSEIVFG